jgi:hypothetical protein
MSLRFQPAFRIAVSLAVVFTAGLAYGQFGRPGAPVAPQRAEPEPFSGKGKVQGVWPDGRGGYIVGMLNDKNELWGLKIGKSTRIRIKGKAEPDFLQRGLNVQFNAMVDKKAVKLKEPVKKLTIFTESNEFTLGLFPDVGGAAAADAGGAVVEGDYKPYVVAGRVMTVKGEDLFVQVPSFAGRLHVELAKDVDIDFNVGFNPNFVSTTDEVQAAGSKAPLPNNLNQAQAGAGYGAAAARMGGRRGMGHMGPGMGGAAGVAGAAGAAAGGAPQAGGFAGAPQAGGFAGAPAGTPMGLVNVTEASILKTEKLTGPQKKTGHGRKPKAEKKETEEK